MPLSRRYTPEWFPGEACNIGMDFSYVIPPGVGIASGELVISDQKTLNASADFVVGPIQIQGRVMFVNMSGGVIGNDYFLDWYATDSDGNVYPRRAMLLCSATS